MKRVIDIIKGLFVKGKNLRQKAVKGGVWMTALKGLRHVLLMGRLVLLARILSPNDFGIMGVALLAMATLETFSRTGLQEAIIRRRDDAKEHLNVVWTVLVLRSVFLSALLFAVAPWAALLFKSPASAPFIRIISISFLLQGFTNIGVVYFHKDMEFSKQFFYEISGVIADFIVAVTLALLFRNIWAMILGYMSGEIVKLIASYVFHPYRPKFDFNFGSAMELFHFGKWIFLSSALSFVLISGDYYVVGSILGTLALGYYQMAFRIGVLPLSEISPLIAHVAFPAFAKLQDEMDKLRYAYLKVVQLSGFVGIPIAGAVLFSADELIPIVFGAKWIPIIPSLKVFCIMGGLGSTIIGGQIFMVMNRPDLEAKIAATQLFIIASMIVQYTLKWSFLGTATAIVLSRVTFFPVIMLTVIRLIKMGKAQVFKLMRNIFFPVIACGGFAMAKYASLYFLKDSPVGILAVTLAAGSLLFMGIIWLLASTFDYDVFETFSQILGVFKKKNEDKQEALTS